MTQVYGKSIYFDPKEEEVGQLHGFLFVWMTNTESVSYPPREVLVVFLPDAQTTPHILPPHEELTPIWEADI